MNDYPKLLNDIIKEFKELMEIQKQKKCEKNFLFTVGLPYFEKISRIFSKLLKGLIKNTLNVNINVY